MFSVIYTFRVKEGRDKDFIVGWRGLTKLIYEYEGSLGSRLHKKSEGEYVAYAQWPSKEVWKNAGGKLPEIAAESRDLMKYSCEDIQTAYELDVIEDLVKPDVFSGAI